MHLRMDAHWWLVNSDGATRMVIAIGIRKNPNALRIEIWEMGDGNGHIPRSRNQQPRIPTCTQACDIDHDGVVNPENISLTIPYLTIFDDPHVGAADIVLSPQDLSRFTTTVYPCFQLQ